MVLQWGAIDNKSTVQSIRVTVNLPISYETSYCICVNGQEGKGIPGYNNKTITSFYLQINGPWGNWPSRYGNWITIGY